MNLTKNFTLEELTRTDTGADNSPNDAQKEKLLYVASFILQPVRDRFGPQRVNSAFRSEWVNEKIGGSKTSQHMEAEAVDFFPLEADFDIVFEWCRTHLVFGQLIKEEKVSKGYISKWIHCSLPRINGMNMQVLSFNGINYELLK